MLRRIVLTMLGACALVLVAASLASAQAKPAAKPQAKPAAKPQAAPPQGRRAPGTYATIVTNHGAFTIRLMPDKAPKAVANFVGLAQGTINPANGKAGKFKPFYNGLTFHRIIDGFMIQGGDPTGTGRGGTGYKFADEIDPARKFDKAGIVAMANSGPNTNGSQFFVTVAPYPQLPRSYTIFGEVVDGLAVVQAIGKLPTDSNDKPLRPVVMKTVTIQRVQ